MQRWIIHIDMDAFFASVEQRDHEEYRGKPLIVGGAVDKRGVVSTASYEARKYGVHSAMPMAEAVRLCPNGIFITANMANYKRESNRIMEIFKRYTPIVEAVSIDEAFLDVTGSIKLFGTAEEIAQKIKNDIKKEVNLTASVGVANCKFMAKLASEMRKPDGFYVLPMENLEKDVWPMPIKNMLGIGKSTAVKLESLGLKTIGDIAKTDQNLLKRVLGKNGESVWRLANGDDDRIVITARDVKSIGREMTFPHDIDDFVILEKVLSELAEEISYALRNEHLRCRTVSLKVRFDDWKTITRAATLKEPTANYHHIYQEGKILLNSNVKPGMKIRLIGLSGSNLTADQFKQETLFDDGKNEKFEKLDAAVDLINEKYGKKTVLHAKHMDNEFEHRSVKKE